jgi:excisionase family DNA binding protein
MKRTRRVKITKVERRSVRLPTPRKSSHAGAQPILLRADCRACGREVETLTTAHAAEVLDVDVGTLRELIAASRIHAIQTVSGNFRICKDSLFEPVKHADLAKV